MKFSDLNPVELNDGYIAFDCPLAHPHRILVPTDSSVVEKAWGRSGEFPHSLTLTPSIHSHTAVPREHDLMGEAYDAASRCGWHGFITNGEVTAC